MTTTDPWAACDHDPTSTTAAPAAQPTTAATLELARADASAPRPAHHLHVVALGSAQHMQQTHLAGPAHPHAHRMSQSCSARTAGSSGSPSWAAASAYRLARTMIRAPPPRCTQKAGRGYLFETCGIPPGTIASMSLAPGDMSAPPCVKERASLPYQPGTPRKGCF